MFIQYLYCGFWHRLILWVDTGFLSNVLQFFIVDEAFFSLWCCGPRRAMTSFLRFLDHTQRYTKSVGLLWTSDQPVAKTSTWQHTILTTDHHAPGGIRTHNLSRRAAVDLRLRPRVHWDRQLSHIIFQKNIPDFMASQPKWLKEIKFRTFPVYHRRTPMNRSLR